jgi:hypothetical protein
MSMRALATVLIVSCGLLSTPAAQSRVEDIYLARSIRESQVKPTEFCTQARTGFAEHSIEDRYSFQSVATRASDGLITDDNVNAIGHLRACFGPTPDPMVVNFYAEGGLGGVKFTGKGECLTVKRDHPENGLTVARCFLELRGLPDGYVGGQLTTNTMRSRALIGSVTDPPGYTQMSIATVRLWKRR